MQTDIMPNLQYTEDTVVLCLWNFQLFFVSFDLATNVFCRLKSCFDSCSF